MSVLFVFALGAGSGPAERSYGFSFNALGFLGSPGVGPRGANG